MGVSGRNRCLRKWIVGEVESLSEAGAERAVVDGTAYLQQQIGPSSRRDCLEIGGADGEAVVSRLISDRGRARDLDGEVGENRG